MRFPSLLVLSVLAAPVFAQTPQPQPINPSAPVVKVRQIVPTGSVSYTSKAAGFAVYLPLQPILAQQSNVIPGGKTLLTHFFSVRSEPVNYIVTSVINPVKIDFSSVGALLDGTQKGVTDAFVARGLGPHLQKSEALQLDQYAGREVKLSLSKGTVSIRVRFYVTPKSVYSITAIGFKADMQAQTAQITRVFDSFRILPQ